MNRKNLLLFPILMGTFFVLSAQETKIYTHENKAYQDALALYNNGQYQAAQNIFESVKANTKFYMWDACCQTVVLVNCLLSSKLVT